ncbi:hypothetical protein GE09DRAFT_1214739 [Coniochaeta sp. 2T2.1]|nr:hypothetical protein GE09DRAFT_1214739 [Coniochaeta sp. 2T2.1]
MSEEIKARTKSCPGEGIPSKPFKDLNVKRGRKEDEPFFDPASANNMPLAMDTIKKTQKADASDNIFFIAAHDEFIRDVVDLYPKNANDWKAKGWREKAMWAFLADLAPAAAGTLK